MPDKGDSYFCPRDNAPLCGPADSNRSAFSDHGIFSCPECSGMLLNAEAASNSITEGKLKAMHKAFESDCDQVDLDCPCCDSKMRVRKIVFKRINGTDMDPIELDGCPQCNTFWFDSGELQSLISPEIKPYDEPEREASALLMALELLILLPHKFV